LEFGDLKFGELKGHHKDTDHCLWVRGGGSHPCVGGSALPICSAHHVLGDVGEKLSAMYERQTVVDH